MVTRVITAYKFDRLNMLDEQRIDKESVCALRWMMRGEAKCVVDGEEYLLRSGEMLLTAPNVAVGLCAAEEKTVSYACSLFECDLTAFPQIPLNKPVSLYGRAGEMLLDYFYAAAQVFGGREMTDEKTAQRYCCTALELLLLHLHIAVGEDRALVLPEQMKTSTHASGEVLTQRVKEYFAEHLSEQVTLDTLCKVLGAGQSTLLREFRRDTGTSVMAYFSKMRIDEAIRMICDTDLSFRSISERLGFESPEYFSRVFKRETGLTPTEFSKQQSKWKGCLASMR